MKQHIYRIAGGALLFFASLWVQSGEVWALERSILLEKGMKALKFSFDEKKTESNGETSAPILFIYKDAVRLQWRKNLAKGGFVGIEGRYDLGQDSEDNGSKGRRHNDGTQRTTFEFKAAMGLALNDKSRFYLFTGASNAGLHITDNRYQRDADFYLGVGFEWELKEDVMIRAEYNLTNYGQNWIRGGFTEIDTGQQKDSSFLTRMKMLF